MAATVDIAGALAPAASPPAKPGEARTGGAPRGASSAGKAKSRGARTSAAANCGAEAADVPVAFDAQLDAALPDPDESGKAKSKPVAPEGAPHAPALRDADSQTRDQVAAGAVLTPWTFVPVVDVSSGVTPDVTGDSIAPPSDAEAASGAKASDTATGASPQRPAETHATVDEGPGPHSNAGKGAPVLQQSLTPPSMAESVAVPPASETVTETGFAYVRATDAAAPRIVASAPGSVVPQSPSAGESSTSVRNAAPAVTVDTPDAPAATNSQAADTPDGAPTRVIQPIPTVVAEPSAPTHQTTNVSEPSVEPSRSADASAATATVATAIDAARPEQGVVDVQATAAVVSTVAPAGRRADVVRGDAPAVKGRSAMAHVQRHGLQAAAPHETETGQRAVTVDAAASIAAIDDQRRNGSSAEADISEPKTAAPAIGSDAPPHEAPPASATRVIHPGVSAMPTIDGARQVSVDGTPLADAPPAPAADVPDADTPHRLVQSMRLQFLRGGGEAIVQLHPEHLGQVTVSLRVEQGSVAARITAADPVVAEWLEARQQSLRDGLQANGLTLDRLSIDRDGRSPDRRERREPPPRQRFRQSAEPQSTFELTI